jgi:hypothetical protein
MATDIAGALLAHASGIPLIRRKAVTFRWLTGFGVAIYCGSGVSPAVMGRTPLWVRAAACRALAEAGGGDLRAWYLVCCARDSAGYLC